MYTIIRIQNGKYKVTRNIKIKWPGSSEARGHFWGGNIYGIDNQRRLKRDSHLQEGTWREDKSCKMWNRKGNKILIGGTETVKCTVYFANNK